MKRKYVKPYLLVESYQLDAECAACSTEGYQALNYGETTCDTDDGYFFGDESLCAVDIVHGFDGNEDGFCYHGMFGGEKMFTYS